MRSRNGILASLGLRHPVDIEAALAAVLIHQSFTYCKAELVCAALAGAYKLHQLTLSYRSDQLIRSVKKCGIFSKKCIFFQKNVFFSKKSSKKNSFFLSADHISC